MSPSTFWFTKMIATYGNTSKLLVMVVRIFKIK